jgi:hypothetical protein
MTQEKKKQFELGVNKKAITTGQNDFLDLAKKTRKGKPIPQRILGLDPGDSTGWCFFYDGLMKHTGEVPGVHEEMDRLMERLKPDLVVFELYRIYSWKVKQHANSDVPTLQLIGQIKLLCDQKGIPWVSQSAAQGKGFVTDDKLKRWSWYFDGAGHAMDSIRHVCQWILFPTPTNVDTLPPRDVLDNHFPRVKGGSLG